MVTKEEAKNIRDNVFQFYPEFATKHADSLEEIASLLADPTIMYQAIRIHQSVYEKNPSGIVDLVKRYHLPAEGLLFSLGSEVLELEQKHRQTLSKIALDCGIYNPSGETVINRAFLNLKPKILDRESSVYTALAADMGAACWYGFEKLLPEVIAQHPGWTTSVVKNFGRSSAGLLENFGLNFWTHYITNLEPLTAINQNIKYGYEPEYVFKHILFSDFRDNFQSLSTITDHYREASGQMFKTYANGVRTLSKNTYGLPKRAKEQLGITHLFRYIQPTVISREAQIRNNIEIIEELDLTNFDTSLLENSLANLETPSLRTNKPLALAIYNQHDHNESFSKLEGLLHPLNQFYKLIIMEAARKTDFFSKIEQVGQLQGMNPDGTAKKPISMLIIGGHGTKTSISLGNQALYSTAESDLNLTDADGFRIIAGYLSNKSTIILQACSNGEGGKETVNMATMIHQAIPQATVFAPTGDTWIDKIILFGSGKIDVVYNCGQDNTLRLETISSTA